MIFKSLLSCILFHQALPTRNLYKKENFPWPSQRFIATIMALQEDNLRKGHWLKDEDEKLVATVSDLGEHRWDALAKASGLRRSGKSCRLRWMNYLRPNLKHGHITAEEERMIFLLHCQWGNKWSKIAQKLPGRTDNEVKNYWRSQSSRKRAQPLHEQDHNFNEMPINISDNNQDLNFRPLSPNSNIEQCISVKGDIPGSSSEMICADSLTKYESPPSPYERRLTNWIYSEADESLESRLCNPELLSLSNDISLWDSSDSIWNAN